MKLSCRTQLAPGSPCGPAIGAPIASVTELALGLPQHPDEDRPKDPVLLAVDQGFGERPRLRIPPEFADPVGSLEVGEHQDAEQLGAASGAERVETCLQSALKLVRSLAHLRGVGSPPQGCGGVP
jgi:hypothetical protein